MENMVDADINTPCHAYCETCFKLFFTEGNEEEFEQKVTKETKGLRRNCGRA
jgi:hypothetical protein